MYRDICDMTIIIINHHEISGNIEFDINGHVPDNPLIVNFGALGLQSPEMLLHYGNNFDLCFYNKTGVDFNRKWKDFRVIRDIARENALIDRLNLRGKYYIFVHDDINRGMVINKIIYDEGVCIVRPDFTLTDNIFDWCSVIDGAHEVHCIDSSFLNMIDIMGLGRSNFAHFYTRPSMSVKWLRPIISQRWRVIE